MKSKFVLVLIGCMVFGSQAMAARVNGSTLNLEEIRRVRELKQMINEVDPKPVEQTIRDIEKTGYPQIQIQLREAMAKAYHDIVQEQDVKDLKKRQWLYSMVALNMAYLQFGGDKDSAGGTKNLNKLIRQKLKYYLPANIYHQKGFLCSLG